MRCAASFEPAAADDAFVGLIESLVRLSPVYGRIHQSECDAIDIDELHVRGRTGNAPVQPFQMLGEGSAEGRKQHPFTGKSVPQFPWPMQRNNSFPRAGRAPDTRSGSVLAFYERLLVRVEEYLPILEACQDGGVVFVGALSGWPAVHFKPFVRVGKEPLPFRPLVHLVVVAHARRSTSGGRNAPTLSR